jgi:ABC-type oligopeptide transport system ATPase subunit
MSGTGPASSGPALTVSGVSKIYRVRGRGRKTVTAVDDVSFTIPPGAAVGLVGASGSGKSTLASQFAPKLPHQLSGGQRQRVLITRALGSDPELIVADEPVSMLDVSLRAGVLKLLADLRRQRGLSLLYITHDLLSARLVTDEILVLNSGRIVEQGPTKQVLQHPTHSYTIQLLDAVPNPFATANAHTGSAQTRRDGT